MFRKEAWPKLRLQRFVRPRKKKGPKLRLRNFTMFRKEAGPSESATSSLVVAGNGLKGMQERVHELSGTISWQQNEQGFYIAIHIPEGE